VANEAADNADTRGTLMRSRLVVAVAIAATCVVWLPARHTQAQQHVTGTVTEGVHAVLVDVVVRDKRGMPVLDLAPSDFEVLEDNVPQTVGSFTRISDGRAAASPVAASAGSASSPAATPPSGLEVGSSVPVAETPSVTALVFDRLTPEARRLAVQAAQRYFGSKEEAPGYVGIFGIDLALTPYAPFTRTSRTLQQGLTKLMSRASASFNNPEQREQKATADQTAAAANQAAAGVAAAGGPGASTAMGSAPADALIAEMQSKMIHDFDVMEHDEQGYATTNGLFAIINTMRGLPGRKSLVLFSEGIAIPPAVQRLFLGVIDSANRANVSIYTMDAAGLRAESEQAKIRDQVNDAARRGIDTAYATSNKRNSAPLTQGLEDNEDVLRQDPHSGLGQLAQSTGGLLFENTNNLRQGFDRIESDLRNYYLIGYTPTNDKYDGRFRTIDVRVKRPGLTVAARKGYFAVRDTGGLPVNEWEAPALGALDQKPVPNAFPVRTAALLFPERQRPGLTPVLVDLKTAPLTFQPTADGKTYTSDFAVIVRFLDSDNRVARKVSQHYQVNGPMAEIDRAKQGEVIFYREPELPSGVYSMETVVYDAPSGKASVRYSTVEVPKPDPAKVTMSSLVLVKRGEKIPEKDRRADNPLLVSDLQLYPNLGEAIGKSAKEVGFYFVVYPAPQGGAPSAAIELLQNGTAVAQIPMPLAAADARGRIQAVGRLPIETLAPATYELRAIVKQGSDQIFRSAMLHIVE
jgi:VWFA-related protein